MLVQLCATTHAASAYDLRESRWMQHLQSSEFSVQSCKLPLGIGMAHARAVSSLPLSGAEMLVCSMSGCMSPMDVALSASA